MRVAVTYDNGLVFQHFGHTEEFKLYDIEDNKVVSSEIISSNGSGHGALATLLNTHKVDVLICGGIGQGAQMALKEANIKLYGGVSGSCDDVINDLINGSLSYNANVTCNHHHDHEHTGSCHSHSCKSGRCH